MNIKSLFRAAGLALLLATATPVLSVSAHQPATPLPVMQTSLDPDYNVSYDSFVLGALPVWITRSYDDGPKRITISIRFEGSSYTSYEYIDIYGTEAQATFNQYAGPGFVEVNIVEINPL